MVRTRHRSSGDHEEESHRKFISLDREKGRFMSKNREHSAPRSHDASSNDDEDDLDGLNIFEEKVVNSRLRPRTGPRRAYNYLDADSSDDEIQMRIGRPSSRRFEERMSLSREMKEDMIEEEQERRRGSSERSPRVEEEEMGDETNVSTRRSMRQRRQVYETTDQSYLVSSGKKEKRSSNLNRNTNNGKNDSDEERKDHDDDDDANEQETEDNLEFSDMYSRVKRKRISVKRNMYGIPINDSDSDSEQEDRNCNSNKRRRNAHEDDDDEDEDGKETEQCRISTRIKNREQILRKREPEQTKSYSLREHKPRTDLYKAPVEEKRHRKIHQGVFDVTPTKKIDNQPYHSPAIRRKVKKRSAIHSSSTSSSSESESNDEKSFKRRKAKSMAKARSRMMPMNFSANTPPTGIVKDRVKSGASLADVEPMNIDKHITFNSIGGLGKHIRAMKEMVVFPLLYDKIFQRFKVDPPRGVLFYGPPGTGKTLVARALANECSHGDKKVAFFMRKGADCLSKWVGESERQLRLLFDQAYKFRPSIIFFDEIDGLAPVRSSRQDQIHSSIVSTLLALMDGMDSRGEIVVIGATNRIDSLDPALRRPGRFDREFLFPLPSLEARKQIMKIHTAAWNPQLNDSFIGELAEKCVGYCGADLKALCTEAAMLALRRRYPQIYISNEVLQLDESSVNVSAKDFFDAIGNIVPTSQRACDTPARALSLQVLPLLERQLDKVMDQLSDTFPSCLSKLSSLDAAATSSQVQALAEAGTVWDEFASDEDEDAPSIYVTPSGKGSKSKGQINSEGDPSTSCNSGTFLNFTSYATSRPATFRPRLLLTGQPGQGQTTYIAPAVIHKMEDLPVHVLDLPALYAVTAKTPEESCANVFHEAKRKSPSIIYLPYINQWWDVMGDTLRATLLTLIQDLNPSMPLLLLATSEQPYKDLDPMLKSLFSQHCGEVIAMTNPAAEDRRIFFKDLLTRQSCKPPPQKKQAGEILKLLEESKRPKRRHYRRSRRFNRFRKQADTIRISSEPDLRGEHTGRPDSINGARKKNDLQSEIELTKIKKHESIISKVRCVQPCMHSAPKSVHSMVLRRRGNYSQLNRNHSARDNRRSRYCCILRSNDSRITRSCTKDGFRKSSFGHSSEAYLLKGLKYEKRKRLHSGYKIPIRTKYNIGKFFKLAGPSRLSSIKESRNFHRNISLLEGRLQSSSQCLRVDTTQEHMSLASQASSRNNRRRKKKRSGIGKSLLSCGSFQMLYKKRDKRRHDREMRRATPLPINFRDYRECQMLQREHRLSHFQRHRPSKPRRLPYNLRPRSMPCRTLSNDRAKRMLEVLPKAPPVKPRELTEEELKQLREKEELTLMELRIFLRDVLSKLGSDRKFSIFAKPVNIEDAPDYLEIIEHPMDLSTMMSKIDLHEYGTVRSFMDDIDLICSNALEYNPNRGPMDRVIRHRACALKDTAYAIIRTELDKDFEKMCVEIEESRSRRGVKSSTVPNYYYTKPVARANHEASKSQPIIPSYLHQNRPPRSIPEPEGERFSRRVRGLNTDNVLPLEDVEKMSRMTRNGHSPLGYRNESNSLTKSDENQNTPQEKTKCSKSDATPQGSESKVKSTKSPKTGDSSNSKTSSRKKATKCIWCKPRKKRRYLIFSKTSSASKMSAEDDTQGEKSKVTEGDETEETKNAASTYHQALRIDVSDSLTETDDSKKKSSRLPSSLSSPSGVVTRRQSLSPRVVHTSQNKTPDKDICFTNTEQNSCNENPLETQPQQESLLPKESSCIDSSASDNHLTSLSKKFQDSLHQARHPEKASYVKRLDLDLAITDSGAGSSLESNGDSRDSTDHKLERNSTSRINTETADVSNNCNLALAKHATRVLSEHSQKLEVPTERLTALLSRLVHRTEGYNVERLEKIYSCLSQVIYRHRHSYNRTDMVVELEGKVDGLPVLNGNPSMKSPRHLVGNCDTLA